MAAVMITAAEIYETLARSRSGGSASKGQTAVELAEHAGVHPQTMRRVIRALLADGRITVAWGYRDRIDGFRQRVPLYTVTTAKKASRR